MLVLSLALWLSVAGINELIRKPFEEWTLEESVQLLNDSPWARQATFTQVIGGVGSGLRGEKEILNTFYVRILSALPVRQALARVEQINHGYDEMSPADRRRLRQLLEPGLQTRMRRWIVLAVNFRSNDTERQNQINRFFATETVDTLRNRAFLSTDQFSRIPLRAYSPPRGDGVGARFVFPRYIGDREVIRDARGTLLFQLELPEFESPLTVGFPVAEMAINGELIL